VSTETDDYLAQLDQVEAEADAFLDEVDPEGKDHSLALTRNLRRTVKRHRQEIARIREEALTEARQALIAEKQTESSYRRLGVPPSGRALFSDLDPTDFEAMQARADELRQAGISWPGQPTPPGPPPPDPRALAVQQMQAASAGGITSESAGDLKTRMLAMKADPSRYTDEQIQGAVNDYNSAVTRAAMPSSGVLG
jgi:hypothetical protein